MTPLVAALLIAFPPQNPEPDEPAPARFEISGGLVRRDGSLDLSRLGLGDGGVAAEPRRAAAAGEGCFDTAGGVRVRTLAEGVKLDFASGGELLVDPRGRVHVRDGSRTLPNPAGLRIAMLDGSVVEIEPQHGSDRPLREVRVQHDRGVAVLWRAGRPTSRRGRGGAFHGKTLHAFGDGRALYEVADVGLTVVLERVLCPVELRGSLPEHAVFVVGDCLARSLVEIVAIAEQRAAGDPRTQQIARALASGAPRLFAPGRVYARPAGALGDLVVPLDGGFRMRLDPGGRGHVSLAMLGQGDDVPLCEWTTTNVTRLHLVQRESEDGAGPRYLMRGYELGHLTKPLLDFEPSRNARARARRTLVELADTVPGAGSILPVERRDG